jgi:hypothetical protein
MNSRRILAMFWIEICFGHTASHSPWFEQSPNPSASICAIIASARRPRSGSPCGSQASWLILALTNSEADAFGHAATQAPQPMQVAASMALSAASFGTSTALPSGAEPTFVETKPPLRWMRSKDSRLTTRSLITGNGPARNGSTVMVSPSL